MNAQERRLDAAMKEIDLSYGYWPAEVREVIDALVERAEQAEAIGTIRKENPVSERTETHTVTEETTTETTPAPQPIEGDRPLPIPDDEDEDD